MGSIVETRFSQIRKRLDNAGYHESFDIKSLSLVERLTLDIFQLKEQLGVELKSSSTYKTILDEVELGAGLFKGENLRLIRENSKLRLLVQQNEETLAEKLQKNRTKLRDLETENSDLKLLIKQFVERVKKQENECLEKSRRLALLEERHLRVNVVISGEAADNRSMQVMQMDCTAPNMCQHCIRMRNCCSVKCEDAKYASTLDYAKVADSRIDALSQQNRYLKNAQRELEDLIKSLKSGIQMRETELERLRTDLDLCGYRTSEKGDQDVDDHTIRELQVALKSAQLQLKVLQRRNIQLEKKIQQNIFHPYDGTKGNKSFEDAGTSAMLLEDEDFESFWGGLKITKKLQLLEKQLSRCIKEKIELKQALEDCEKHRAEKPVQEIHISNGVQIEDQESEQDIETSVPLQNTSTRIIETRAVRSVHTVGRSRNDPSEERVRGNVNVNQSRPVKNKSITNQPSRTNRTGTVTKLDQRHSSSTNGKKLQSIRKSASSTVLKVKSKDGLMKHGGSGALKSDRKWSITSLDSQEVQQSGEREQTEIKSTQRTAGYEKTTTIKTVGRFTSSRKNSDTNQSHGNREIQRNKSKEALTKSPVSRPDGSTASGPRHNTEARLQASDHTEDTGVDNQFEERPTRTRGSEAVSENKAGHRSYGDSQRHSGTGTFADPRENAGNKSPDERRAGRKESDASEKAGKSSTASGKPTEMRQPLGNKSSNLAKTAGMQNVHTGKMNSLVPPISETRQSTTGYKSGTLVSEETPEKKLGSQEKVNGFRPRKVKMLYGKSKSNVPGRAGSSQTLDPVSQEEDDLSFEELSDEEMLTNLTNQQAQGADLRDRGPQDEHIYNSKVSKSVEKARIQKQKTEYRASTPTSRSENDEDGYAGGHDRPVDRNERTRQGNGMGSGHGEDAPESAFRSFNPRPKSSVNIDYCKKRMNVHSGYDDDGRCVDQNADEAFASNSQPHGYGTNVSDNFARDLPNRPYTRLEERTHVRDDHEEEFNTSSHYEARDIRQRPPASNSQTGNGKSDEYLHETPFEKKPSSQGTVSGSKQDKPNPDMQKSRNRGLHNQSDIPPSNTKKYSSQEAAIDTYGAIGNDAITSMRQRAGERIDTELPPYDIPGETQYFQHENVDNYRTHDAPSSSYQAAPSSYQATKFSSVQLEPEQPSTSGGVTQVLNIRQIVHQDSDMSDKQRKDLEREVQRLKRALEEALDHREQLERVNQRLRLLLEQAEADARRKENQLKSTSVGGFLPNAAEHQNLVADLRRMKSREASLESEITTLRTTAKSLDRDKDEMRIELDRKDEQLSRLNAENRQLSDRLMKLVQTVKNAELELGKSGESRHDLQREIDAYKRQIDNLRLDLKRRIDERDVAKKDLIRLTQSTSKSEFERRSISVELEKRSKESDELRRQVKVYIDEIRRIEEILDQKDEELRSLMESYDVLSKEKGALESQRLPTKRGFLDSGDEGMGMTTSTSKLLHQQSAIQSYEEEIRDLSDQIAKLEGQLRTSQDREKHLDRELIAAKDLCTKLEAKVDSLRYDFASSESTKHKLQAENEQLIANFEAIQRQAGGDQEAQKKLEDIISKLREKDYEIQKELKSIVLERDSLQSQLNQLQSRSEQLKEETERYRMRCAELQNEVEKTRRLYHQEKLECEAALAELKRVQSNLNSSSTNFLVTSALGGGGGSMMSPNYPSATSFIPGEISPVLPPNSPDAAPHETVMLSPEAAP